MKKAILAAAMMGASALAATAQPGPGGPGGREGMRGERPMGARIQAVLENPELLEKIGLTDQQVSALRARLDEAQKTMIKLRADAELAETEVQRLMREDTVDRAAVMKALDAAGLAHVAVRKAMIEERLAFREIAGPDAARKLRQHLGRQMKEGRGRDDEDRPFRKERKGPGAGGPPVED